MMITVITAVKNGIKHLEGTLSSIKKLKSKNMRYIVVDGNSDDGTVDLIKQYDDIIDEWVSAPDSGLFDAYNKGWEIAKKDSYVLFIGSGDQLIELPQMGSGCGFEKVICGKVDTGRKRMFVSRVSRMTKFANTLHHQALLVPKKLHIDPPFNTTYQVYADFDFNQRLIKMGASFQYSHNFLAYAMPGGVSENYSKESYIIAYKNFGMVYGLMAYMFYAYQKGKLLPNRKGE